MQRGIETGGRCDGPGIYVHIPFCRQKCPYCDFVSGPHDHGVCAPYIQAVCREATLRSAQVSSLCFQTLYVGGGTPSLLASHALRPLLETLRSVFHWHERPEATIEVNPDSASLEWMGACRDMGINRISIGVQSLSDAGLHVLGRVHDTVQALNACEMARAVGFDAVSVDIIYGWPGQTLKELRQELNILLALAPDHVSCYQLTLEPGTPMERMYRDGLLPVIEEDIVLQLTDYMEDFLMSHGYNLYEISNFARPGFECRHNLNYWSNGEYLGLGCAAVSFLKGERISNTADFTQYLNSIADGLLPVAEVECLNEEAHFRETMMLGLRRANGISISGMETKFHINPLRYYGDTLYSLMDMGLVTLKNDRLFLSHTGRRLANQIFMRLI
jgi:oxygen-independent coproporphyrinogen-3 oxidase